MTALISVPGLNYPAGEPGLHPRLDEPIVPMDAVTGVYMLTDSDSEHFVAARGALVTARTRAEAAESTLAEAAAAEEQLLARLAAGDQAVTSEQMALAQAAHTRANLLQQGSQAALAQAEKALQVAELLAVEDEARAYAQTVPAARADLDETARSAREVYETARDTDASVRAKFGSSLNLLGTFPVAPEQMTERVIEAAREADVAQSEADAAGAAAAQAAGSEEELLARLAAGDSTVTAAELAEAAAARLRADLLHPAAASAAQQAHRAIKVAAASDIRCQWDAYSSAGQSEVIAALSEVADQAAAVAREARDLHNATVRNIGTRLRLAGGPPMNPGNAHIPGVGWVGVPPNPFGSTTAAPRGPVYGFAVDGKYFSAPENGS